MRQPARALQDRKLERAIRWISTTLQDAPGANRVELVDRASQTFGLSLVQAEFLYRLGGRAA
jgi:hypothetical protein